MGCGRSAPKGELVRFAARDGVLAPDPAGRLEGRGAHLCPQGACWERALARKAFPRALRAPVTIPDETVHFTFTWPRNAFTS